MDCSICHREISVPNYAEKHHLTPKSKGGKDTAIVCIDCGDQIHNLFDNKELKREYNTIEKLISHPAMIKWVKWIRKKKVFGVCMKQKKRKK
jgi:hypothetical protein